MRSPRWRRAGDGADAAERSLDLVDEGPTVPGPSVPTRPYPPARFAAAAQLLVAVLAGVLSAVLAVVVGPLSIAMVWIAILGLLVTAFAPGLLFAAFLLVPAFYKGALQPLSPVDLSVALAVLCMLQAIPVAFERRDRHVSNAGIVLWVLLAFLLLAGVLYAPDQGLALTKVGTWWGLAFLPILPAAMRVGSKPRYLEQFVWGLFLLGVPMVLLGIAEQESTRRLDLLGVDQIAVSRAVLLVPLIGFAFVLRRRPRVIQLATIALIPAAFFVALAAGSRGPLLVLLLLAAMAIVINIPRLRPRHLRTIGPLAGVAVVSLIVLSAAASQLPAVSLQRFTMLSEFVQSAMSGQLETSVGDTSSGTRVELYRLAVSMFEESPVLGIGPGGFESLVPLRLGPEQQLRYPHNAFLQIAAELGIVGALVFLALVGLAVFRRLPSGPWAQAVWAAFYYFLFNAMISRGIYEDRTMWGLLMLVLLVRSPAAMTGRFDLGRIRGFVADTAGSLREGAVQPRR